MYKLLFAIPFSCLLINLKAQNPVAIPPTLSGTEFDLHVQNGSVEFFPGIVTPTYGVNGNILGPTLIVNKWDTVTIHVTNDLTGTGNSTTMHWHGMHVPAMDDGGPHQIIEQGATWSPNFRILNNAGTFWYHPHGQGKTDLQVARGIAGFILVKDSAEAELDLPRNYGVDDFPLAIQTKAFDLLYQVAIATQDDTLVCVNATPDAYLDAPAQVVRLRLLNGASMRTFNIGFTGDKEFYMIGGDGGLLDAPVALTRLRLAPGERAEILLDLQGLEGTSFHMLSYSNELPNGIYGAATVIGMMGGTITDYALNPLNGDDFNILQINVVSPTADPVLSIPASLIPQTPYTEFDYSRTFTLAPENMMDATQQVMGPFLINGNAFNINEINETVFLNAKEKWRITNNTGIAHPFHIHDIEFNISSINGAAPPDWQAGKKDVVLVMPMEFVEIITEFNDFANDSVPYMYHCHMLHHEDDGMMGSFTVIDTSKNSIGNQEMKSLSIYPNPAHTLLQMENPFQEVSFIEIQDLTGKKLYVGDVINDTMLSIDIAAFPSGMYTVIMHGDQQMAGGLFVKY